MAERAAAFLARLEPLSRAIAIAIALVLLCALTLSTWGYARVNAEDEARIRFEARASRIAEAISGRMVDYEQVLRGAVGLFAATSSVERHEWRSYVEHLRIESIYPGIQAIGFVSRVPKADKARHEIAVRKDGFPEYAIRPAGSRLEYAPITFIEPFNNRNLRAFGFDMMYEAERRATLERARDTGRPAISGRLTLVQETDKDVQAGFIMFVPVYRKGMDTVTVAQRRAAVAGYVYSPFRADDLMLGILGRIRDVRLRVVDAAPGGGGLLYDSWPGAKLPAGEAMFEVVVDLPMRGRTWRLAITSLDAFESTIDYTSSRLIAVATGAIGALLLALIFSLSSTRARALRLARTMTKDLRESRERLSLAIEGSGQAMFDWDVNDGRVVLSDQWAVITGGDAASQSTTAADLQALVHPDDMPQVSQQIKDLLGGRLPFYHVEHRVRTATGWRWISSRAKVVERDASGRALRVAGTNVDITDRKEVERLKAEFVSTVSHELRTPLTALIGALGLLDRQAEGRLTPDAAMFLSMARQNSDRLAALINDILDIEKIESGRMEFHLSPVAIRPLLERAVTLNAAYAEKLGVRFELGTVEDAVVAADEDRLLQVLTNLMSNAVKYSPAGAAVTISAETRGGAVRVKVTDRGAGVPEAFRDRIFGKFAQADSSDTRRKGGTGLGLSISRAIVEKLGGTIGYDSVPGLGATFYFDMPVRE